MMIERKGEGVKWNGRDASRDASRASLSVRHGPNNTHTQLAIIYFLLFMK
jgi:hypothetical protein